MEDHVLEIAYPVVEEPKADDVLEIEYPVVEEHIVEFHEIFEDGQANREENNNDRRLYCKYCGKNFKSHNYVKMHERWHRGELNHHCPECNRAFRYPSELKKHTTIHTGQLPYKCDDCDLRFNKAQAAHEHRLRDHVGMLENATQDSKSLHPPIVFQMNNNYQPMSFEVVLPNLHTPTQRMESKLERGNDPLTEGFSADSYARPAPMPRSSVIRPNYACRQEPNYACRQELSYVQGAGTARLEEPTMWRESARWVEEMQFGRNYGVNASIEDGREATEVDQFVENMNDVDTNYGSHVHIQKPNMEECRKCRQIMEYENEIAQLRNHHCARK